jgi:hypothetical protein
MSYLHHSDLSVWRLREASAKLKGQNTSEFQASTIERSSHSIVAQFCKYPAPPDVRSLPNEIVDADRCAVYLVLLYSSALQDYLGQRRRPLVACTTAFASHFMRSAEKGRDRLFFFSIPHVPSLEFATCRQRQRKPHDNSRPPFPPFSQP